MFDPAVNTEYMPSQRVPNARDYFAAWARDSAALRGQTPPQELAYGSGEHEWIDVFEPADMARATLLFIHGGYWKAFYKDHFSYVAAPLLREDPAVRQRAVAEHGQRGRGGVPRDAHAHAGHQRGPGHADVAAHHQHMAITAFMP